MLKCKRMMRLRRLNLFSPGLELEHYSASVCDGCHPSLGWFELLKMRLEGILSWAFTGFAYSGGIDHSSGRCSQRIRNSVMFAVMSSRYPLRRYMHFMA